MENYSDENLYELENMIADVTYGDYEIRPGYSGRFMLGRNSVLAFVTGIDPRSKEGNFLLENLKLTVDNMGFDWIYYYFKDPPSAEDIREDVKEFLEGDDSESHDGEDF
jgi:hypothetical protein